MQQQLNEPARELLATIVELAETDQPVIVHDNMKTEERQAMLVLMLNGLVEMTPVPPPDGDLIATSHEAWPTLGGYNYLRDREEA